VILETCCWASSEGFGYCPCSPRLSPLLTTTPMRMTRKMEMARCRNACGLKLARWVRATEVWRWVERLRDGGRAKERVVSAEPQRACRARALRSISPPACCIVTTRRTSGAQAHILPDNPPGPPPPRPNMPLGLNNPLPSSMRSKCCTCHARMTSTDS
jgi:hypothetical protein